MRRLACLAMAIALMDGAVFAQAPTNAPIAAATTTPPEADDKAWSFSASAYTYVVPDDREYVQPTFTADRGWLHLEARYNYEALDTGSAWVGYNFSGGEKLAWEFTPMIGGVFGDTTGIAPGYKGSLSWWKLELYSEGEYVFDTGNSSDSFFYNWSELTLAPVEWFRFGMVTQRTRLYKTDRDIQRGVLAGFSFKKVSLTGYVLNPDEDKPTFRARGRPDFLKSTRRETPPRSSRSSWIGWKGSSPLCQFYRSGLGHLPVCTFCWRMYLPLHASGSFDSTEAREGDRLAASGCRAPVRPRLLNTKANTKGHVHAVRNWKNRGKRSSRSAVPKCVVPPSK